MRYYSIIYEAIDDVKQMIVGHAAPEIKETIVGVAQVREVFRSSKFGVVAGCLVTEGVVKRNNPIRVLRDNVVIFEGALESLRRFKDDVERGARRHRVRHRREELPGRARRRPDRVLLARRGGANAAVMTQARNATHRVGDAAGARGPDRARGQGSARRQRDHHGA